MATFRSASVLLSADGTRTPGTAALFAEPAPRKGGNAPWAGDFRPANGSGNGPKNAIGKTFTLELPDGSTGKVVVQSLKSGKGGVVLALMGEDAPPSDPGFTPVVSSPAQDGSFRSRIGATIRE